MTPRPLVIVTGANRGLGNAIAKRILSRKDGPFKLFATSRTGENLSLDTNNGLYEIIYPKLDVGSQSSIHAFRDFVINDHGGEVAVVVNNAGVNLDSKYNFKMAKRTMDVNYRGTRDMCTAFLPHLATNGRVVNLSSVASSLAPYSEEIQQRFRSVRTIEELDRLAEEYETSVSTSTEQSLGFGTPIRAYALSKVLIRSLTSILATSHPNYLINCCCPGWVNTTMGNSIASKGRTAPKTPEEGSVIPVRLALDEDIEGVSGKYWANGSVRSRGRGEVQERW